MMTIHRLCRALARPALDRSGAAAVEFALVVPALTVFIFGIWYIGWLLDTGGDVRHAVEQASRIYISNPSATSTDLSNAVASHLTSVNINQVTLSAASHTVGSATVERITWSYTTTANIPFLTTITAPFSGTVDVPMATP
jgi:Flp pilus assembly protein TadG